MSLQNILIVGKHGQLAIALSEIGSIGSHRIVCVGRPDLDITKAETISDTLERVNPALVINASAYTAVDQAETDRDDAFAVNVTGVGELGRQCASRDIPVIHLSTDYVFDGTSKKPYIPGEKIAPDSIYGHTKAQGEAALREATEHHLIIRTAWLFGEHGNNFLKTMLRLGQSHDLIRVVSDQHGTPTYANDLAQGIARIAAQVISARDSISWGTYHLTNSGETTWFGFAAEIFKRRALTGAKVPEVVAIATSEYPTAAVRPAYSILDCSETKKEFGVALPNWQDATARCLQKLKEASR